KLVTRIVDAGDIPVDRAPVPVGGGIQVHAAHVVAVEVTGPAVDRVIDYPVRAAAPDAVRRIRGAPAAIPDGQGLADRFPRGGAGTGRARHDRVPGALVSTPVQIERDHGDCSRGKGKGSQRRGAAPGHAPGPSTDPATGRPVQPART